MFGVRHFRVTDSRHHEGPIEAYEAWFALADWFRSAIRITDSICGIGQRVMTCDEAEELGDNVAVSSVPVQDILVITRPSSLTQDWPMVQESRIFALIERTHCFYRIEFLHQALMLN
jgi:hypothetical protein